MATLATFFKRSDAVSRGANAASKIKAQDPFILRALPNDGIYFYSKRIDNARVVRQADPAARGECWSVVGAAGVLLFLCASIIAPQVGSVLAGYKLETLKQERQSLVDRKRELDVREASLLSPRNLHELAKARNLTSPAADQVVHLDNSSPEGAFARNQPPADLTAQR